MPMALLLNADSDCLSAYQSALLLSGFSVVIPERSSRGATARCAAPSDFDVLVVDVELVNGESGVAAARTIRQLCPEIGVLFVSGAALNQGISKESIEPMAWPERTAFLSKPFTFDVFIDKVTGLLK